MTSRIALRLAALVLVAAPSWAHAGIDEAGTTAANFLSIGSNPATLAMGGAGIARHGELGLAAWNVSSLAWLGETEIAFSHASLDGQSQQEWAAIGGRMQSFGVRWALNGLYQGEGSFEGLDALGNSTGSFGVSSMALGGMLARPFGEHAGAGLGFKWVSEDLAGVTGSGLALDAGVTVESGLLSFAAAAQNAFGSMSYSGASYPFPSNYGIGAALHVPASGVTLALDANFPKAYYNDVRAGLEWRVRDYVALRTGYRMEMGGASNEPLTGPTFGIGAGANGFWFDYGYLVSGAGSGGQHRLGLTFRPGAMNTGMSGLGQVGSLSPAENVTKPAKKTESIAPVAEKQPAKSPEPVVAARASAKPIEAPKVEAPKTEAPKSVAPAPAVVVPAPAPAKVVEAPKPARVEPPKPKPVIVAPVEAKKETPKSEPVIVPPAPARVVEAPKPLEAPKPAKVVEAPKPLEAPKPAKVEAPKREPVIVAPKPAEAPKSEPVVVAPRPAEAPKSEPTVVAPKPAEAPKSEPRIVVPGKPEPAARVQPRPNKVKVQNGESMADLAKRWDTTVPAIMMENNLVSEKVKNGQQLKLPPPLKH